MPIAKTISAFALATSLVSAALLLAATGSAVAKRGSTHNGASLQREARHDQDSDSKRDRDRHLDREHKQKHREGKHKGKDNDGRHADRKCGGKKKCPDPVVESIRHPGGGAGSHPVAGTGSGKGLGGVSAGAGNASGGSALGDPGYKGPPAGSSSGGGGVGSPGGPSRDGSGTTIKQN